MTNGIWIPFYS